jgi:threonine synthase
MDVSNPSNYPRMMELYNGSWDAIKADITGYRMNDEQTLATMARCDHKTGYMLDPHGAIGYQALLDDLKQDETGIFLETAHPCKFIDTVEKALNKSVPLPDFVSGLMKQKKSSILMDKTFESFKQFLLN